MHILWGNEKVDIKNMISEKMKNFSINTIAYTYRLFAMYGYNKAFGRSMVMEILELKSSGRLNLFLIYNMQILLNLYPVMEKENIKLKNKKNQHLLIF